MGLDAPSYLPWAKSTSRAKRNRGQSIHFHEENGGRTGDVTGPDVTFCYVQKKQENRAEENSYSVGMEYFTILR